jgi:hypothetical protein
VFVHKTHTLIFNLNKMKEQYIKILLALSCLMIALSAAYNSVFMLLFGTGAILLLAIANNKK